MYKICTYFTNMHSENYIKHWFFTGMAMRPPAEIPKYLNAKALSQKDPNQLIY